LYSNQPIKRPYLVNIESNEEKKFVMSLMINKDIKEMYIGANNLVKKCRIIKQYNRYYYLQPNNVLMLIFILEATTLLWETLSLVLKEVDRDLLCSDIKVDNSSFKCGFIKNMLNSELFSDKEKIIDPMFEENLKKNILLPLDPLIVRSFCVNVSDCFIRLPYLCEGKIY
jgi:hypothetical protein